MLTGEFPFSGNDLRTILLKNQKNIIDFSLYPNLSESAKNFILSLTNSLPELRPTAEEALAVSWLIVNLPLFNRTSKLLSQRK